MNNNPMTVKKLADTLAVILIILILFGLFGLTGLFSSIELGLGETITENTVFSTESIDEIKIDASTADINIVKGDALSIDSTKNCFRVNNRNGKITLEERNQLFSRDESRYVTISVPEDFIFNKVEIDTGAADITAENLKAEYLELDVGAGSVTFDNLEASKKSEIDCGAGLFTVKNGSLTDLEFSLGVGEADITAAIEASGDIESGVGELRLNLLGGKDAYTLTIEKGLGIFTVDSEFVKDSPVGNGENKIKIEGGVGSVNISFK